MMGADLLNFLLLLVWLVAPGMLLVLSAVLFKDRNYGGIVICLIAAGLIYLGGILYLTR